MDGMPLLSSTYIHNLHGYYTYDLEPMGCGYGWDMGMSMSWDFGTHGLPMSFPTSWWQQQRVLTITITLTLMTAQKWQHVLALALILTLIMTCPHPFLLNDDNDAPFLSPSLSPSPWHWYWYALALPSCNNMMRTWWGQDNMPSPSPDDNAMTKAHHSSPHPDPDANNVTTWWCNDSTMVLSGCQDLRT